MIKFDDLVIEPLGEAFGQNIETVTSGGGGGGGGKSSMEKLEHKGPSEPEKRSAALLFKEPGPSETQSPDMEIGMLSKSSRTLTVVDKKDGKEASDEIETIIVRDMEQGKCAAFKKLETNTEKKSINEPRYTAVSV